MMRLRLHSEHQLARRPRVPFISAGLMRKEGIGSAKEALGNDTRSLQINSLAALIQIGENG